ncbi:MAG: hypothetical protein ACK2TV_00375 [Anaerolineales bacterium]
MLLLLPIGLLLLSALVIVILIQIQPKFGTSWLIAVITSLVAWGVTFFLRLRLPTTLDLLSWQGPDLPLLGQLSLLLDYNSWPYVLALMTITVAVILSDVARTREDSTPGSWSACLVISALGLFALQSGTSLTLMITWVVIDFFELLYLLRLKISSPFIPRIVISYGVRTASTLFLLFATSRGWASVGTFDLTQIPISAGFSFLMAASLRIGVFPLNLPFLQEPEMSRGTGTILRLTPVALSLGLLTRLPTALIPNQLSFWSPILQGMLAITALYASIRWFAFADAIEGRPFWIIAWGAFAIAATLNGAPTASLAWGIALLLPGSLLFLYFPRIQRMNFLLYLGLLGLLGIPFTPLASGWIGLITKGFNFWTVIFIFSHTFLVLGYINRIMQPGSEPRVLESSARLVYPLSLIIIIQVIITLGLVGWPGSLTLGVWWLAIISNILIIAITILIWRYGSNTPKIHLPSNNIFAEVTRRVLPRLEPIFRLDWVYQAGWHIYSFLGRILSAFSSILEGKGGILWTILLLVLFISLLTGLIN